MGAPSHTRQGFRPRLTQEEKSADTRRRLLDAAVDCLVERGYANTTTSEIAERAGLSRGAQLYHFPKKEELLAGAVGHLFTLLVGEMKEKVIRLTNVNDRRAMAIDLIWELAHGRYMTAWTEIMVASRTDPYMGESIVRENDRAIEFLGRSFKELFPRPADASPEFDLAPIIVMLVVTGMALQTKILHPELIEQVLTILKTYEL
jgi:AcrR family transcriptional regulator